MAQGKKARGKGGRRKGSGRRPLPPAERRSRRVSVYLTESEYERLQALADAEGQPEVSVYLRALTLRHLRRAERS